MKTERDTNWYGLVGLLLIVVLFLLPYFSQENTAHTPISIKGKYSTTAYVAREVFRRSVITGVYSVQMYQWAIENDPSQRFDFVDNAMNFLGFSPVYGNLARDILYRETK